MMVESSKLDSPDSVPSLAETSMASSHDVDVDVDDVVRTLFVYDDSAPFPKEIVENIQKLSDDTVEERDVCGSAISITSSETTVVPSWNLSPKDPADEEDGSFPILFEEPRLGNIKTVSTKSMVDSDDDDGADKENLDQNCWHSPMIEEDPPEEPSSCNGALILTPRQLAEMFMAFEGTRKYWPTKQDGPQEGTAPATPMTTEEAHDSQDDRSRPSKAAASLERECTALKKIIQGDSSKLFNLKKAMEAQRELNELKEIEIEDNLVEYEIAEERIKALKREKDVARERESEMVETIRILKEEVDKLTRYKSITEAAEAQSQPVEVASFDESMFQDLSIIDIQLFSSQIVEQELVMADMRAAIEEKDRTNHEQQDRLKSLQRQLTAAVQTPDCTNQIESSKADTSSNLTQILKNISQRLEVVEREKMQTESTFIEELKKKDEEIHEIRVMLQQEKSERGTLLNISEDPDEIEIILPREHANIEAPVVTQASASHCCCDAWGALSGNTE